MNQKGDLIIPHLREPKETKQAVEYGVWQHYFLMMKISIILYNIRWMIVRTLVRSNMIWAFEEVTPSTWSSSSSGGMVSTRVMPSSRLDMPRLTRSVAAEALVCWAMKALEEERYDCDACTFRLVLTDSAACAVSVCMVVLNSAKSFFTNSNADADCEVWGNNFFLRGTKGR